MRDSFPTSMWIHSVDLVAVSSLCLGVDSKEGIGTSAESCVHVRPCRAKDNTCCQCWRGSSLLNHQAATRLATAEKPLHLLLENVKCGHGSYSLMSTAQLTQTTMAEADRPPQYSATNNNSH